MMKCDRCQKDFDSARLAIMSVEYPGGDGFDRFICPDCLLGLRGLIETFLRWPVDRPLSDFKLGAY